MGVDIFFVISGYLITSIIMKELEQGHFSIIRFYVYRVRRIFPALLLVLFSTLLFGWAVLLPGEFRLIGLHTVAGSGFFSNLLLWHEAGYFDASGNTKPLLHLWSLGIEEQFYAFWPIFLTILYLSRRRLLIIVGLTCAVSFAFNIYTAKNDSVAAFYSPITRFWELVVGGMGAYFHTRSADWSRSIRETGSIFGFFLIVASFFFIKPQDSFPGWWALLPTVGTIVVILAGPETVANRLLLVNPAAIKLGLISYPLYLWHWPLLSYAYIIAGEKPSFLARVVLIIAAAVLAMATYTFVERPVRKISLTPKIVKTLIILMCALAVIGSMITTGRLRERINAKGAETYLAALNDTDFPGRDFKRFYFENAPFQRINAASPTVALFLGDSVVEQYGPFVEKAVMKDPAKFRSVIFATAGSCPPILHLTPMPKFRYKQCTKIVEAGYKFAERPEVKTVVVGAAWYGYFNMNSEGLVFSSGITDLQFPQQIAQDGAYLQLEQTLRGLVQMGKRVYLVLQPPTGSSFDPRNMITGSRFDNIKPVSPIPALRLDKFLKENAYAHDRLISIALQAHANVIDPAHFLCNAEECPVVGEDNVPFYTDTMHMRPFYSRRAAGFLLPAIYASQ